jgi:hypothetical protein
VETAERTDKLDPQSQEQLRGKFLETAGRYKGVPYCRAHCPPEKRGSILFLDCCALIRQAVFDLRKEFGFVLGKGNQAYQFDMLGPPIPEAEALPGDLIFYSGDYLNPRLRPFPHNMVHVEIYLGGGRSLGARWRDGLVSEFDSYRFESKLYKNIQVYFKSIRPWLEGRLINSCPLHKWDDSRQPEWLSEKFSVFANP